MNRLPYTIMTVSPLDARVLRSLPADSSSASWLTAAELATSVGIDESVARSCLVRLGGRDQVTHDGGRPPRWARSVAGDVALEHTPTSATDHASGTTHNRHIPQGARCCLCGAPHEAPQMSFELPICDSCCAAAEAPLTAAPTPDRELGTRYMAWFTRANR